MPYGIPKSKGGDSPENVRKMESCIEGVSGTNSRTGKPYTKSEKIAICKSRLFGGDESALRSHDMLCAQYIAKAIQSGKAENREQAFSQFEKALSKSNYDHKALASILVI